MLFHYSVGAGQPHSHALVARGEEGFKESGLNLGRHATPVVPHGKSHKLTGPVRMPGFNLVIVDANPGGADGENPAAGYGVARIEDEIDDDVFDQTAVGLNVRKVGTADLNGDLLTDQAPQHRVQTLDQPVEIQRFRADRLPSSSRQ